MAYVWLDDPNRRADALRALSALEGVRAYTSDQLPEGLRGLHPRRVGDLVVRTVPPYRFFRPKIRERLKQMLGLGLRGGHGYPTDHPDMAAIFYAMGRGVPANTRLDSVRMIDVAPTLTHLLGIDPPRDSEGTPITGLGK